MAKNVSVHRPSLTTQIMIGLIVGVAVGWIRPEWGNNVYFLRDIFLNLIKSIIGPLVFSTLVVGIGGGGDLRKVGRMGVKALVYFEVCHHRRIIYWIRCRQFNQAGPASPACHAGERNGPENWRDSSADFDAEAADEN